MSDIEQLDYANGKTVRQARGIRLGCIRIAYSGGYIDRDQAIEILQGPLTPNDPSTIVDDSDLLEATVEEIIEKLSLE